MSNDPYPVPVEAVVADLQAKCRERDTEPKGNGCPARKCPKCGWCVERDCPSGEQDGRA